MAGNDKSAMARALSDALERRFGEDAGALAEAPGESGLATLSGMAGRGSVRSFEQRDVSAALLRMLAAVALSSPTKSDLQQRDIVLITDPALRAEIDRLVGDQAWVKGAPAMLIFVGDHQRQRQVHALRGRPFVNDHLDAFFNAAVDAGIALGAFVTAAEAVGLGCCPISAIRNEAAEVSRLLSLPELCFPVAGLGVGWPAAAPELSPRLPLRASLHENRFGAETGDVEALIAGYDARRAEAQPYKTQRFAAEYGESADYGWSEDKARQYSKPERAGFGAYVRAQGFNLD